MSCTCVLLFISEMLRLAHALYRYSDCSTRINSPSEIPHLEAVLPEVFSSGMCLSPAPKINQA
jgi:hypothetical protein